MMAPVSYSHEDVEASVEQRVRRIASDTSRRFTTLILSALGSAILAGLVALYEFKAALPSTDQAYRLTFIEVLFDPLVLMIWVPWTVGGAFLGFVDSCWALRGANLRAALPITMAVTVTVAGFASAKAPPFISAPIALLAAMGAMRLSRRFFPAPPEP